MDINLIISNHSTNHMPTEHLLTSKINDRGGNALEKDAPTKRVKTSSTCSQSTTSRASGRPDVRAPADIGINQSLDSAPPSPPVAQAFVPTAPLLRACTRCVGGGELGVSPTSTAAHIGRNSISDIGLPDISPAGSAEHFFLLGARKARADKEANEVLTNKVQELQEHLGEKISELEQKSKVHEETMRQLKDQNEQLEKKEYTIETIRANYKESNEIHIEMKRRHDVLEEENDELKKQIFKAEASDDKTKRENKKLKQEVKSLKGDIVLRECRIEELEKCLCRIARASRKNNRKAQSVLGRRYLLEDTDDDEEYWVTSKEVHIDVSGKPCKIERIVCKSLSTTPINKNIYC